MKIGKLTLGGIWYAILLMVMGIMLIVGGVGGAQQIASVIVTVVGVIYIVMGILSIVHHGVVWGVIDIVLGVLIMSFAWTIAWVAFLVFGIILIINGFSGYAITTGGVLYKVCNIITGIMVILVACGCGWAWSFANIFFYIAGALMLIDGILLLLKL